MNSDKIASIMDDLSAELPPTLFAVKALVTAPAGTLGHLELRIVTVPFVELPYLLEKGRTAFGSNGCIEVWLAWQRLPEGTHEPDAETVERLDRIAAGRLKLLAVAAGTAIKIGGYDGSTETVVARRYSVCVYRDPLDVRSSWDRKERVCRNLLGRCDDSDLGVDELAHVWLERPEDLDGSVVESLVNVADRNVNCRAEHIRLMLWANSMLAQFGAPVHYSVPITTWAERVSMRVPDNGVAYLQWDPVEVAKDELGCPCAGFDQLVPLPSDGIEAVHAYLGSADDLDEEMIRRMMAQARTNCSGLQLAKLEALAKTLIARLDEAGRQKPAEGSDDSAADEVNAEQYVVVSVKDSRLVAGRWAGTGRVPRDLIGDAGVWAEDDDGKGALAAVWLESRDKLDVDMLDKLAQRAWSHASCGAEENAVWRWADGVLVAMGEKPHYVADLLDDAGGDKAPEDDGYGDAERFVVRTVHEDGSVRVEGVWDKKAWIRLEDVGDVLEADEGLGAEEPEYDVDDDLDTLDRNDVLAHVWLASRDDLDMDKIAALVDAAEEADACGDAEYEALMRWADEMLVALGEEPHYVADSYDEDDVPDVLCTRYSFVAQEDDGNLLVILKEVRDETTPPDDVGDVIPADVDRLPSRGDDDVVLASVCIPKGDELDDDVLERLIQTATEVLRDAGCEDEFGSNPIDLVVDAANAFHAAVRQPRVVDVTLPPPQPHVVDVTLPPPPKPQPQPNYIRW